MSIFSAGSDFRPIFHFRGHPVRLHTLLVVIHCAALIAGTIISPATWSSWMSFSSAGSPPAFLSAPWTFLTHVLVHSASIWFLLEMLWLWQWSRIVEDHFGPASLLKLYLSLTLAPALTLVLLQLVPGTSGYILNNPSLVHFPLFLAVAFLLPDAEWIFGWKFKYWAAALTAIFLLQFLGSRNATAAILLLSNAAITYFYLRRIGLSPRFASLTSRFRSALPRSPDHSTSRKLSQTPPSPSPHPKITPRPSLPRENPNAERINAILDKIADHGIESLSTEERRTLNDASEQLRKSS
jgi:membrane associated rhomboid family serine protease